MDGMDMSHGGNTHVYFEVGATVTAFILTGRYLETRAKHTAGDALRSLLRVTEDRYAAGRASQPDVFRAQTQLTVLETRLAQGELKTKRFNEYQQRRVIDNLNAECDLLLRRLLGQGPGSHQQADHGSRRGNAPRHVFTSRLEMRMRVSSRLWRSAKHYLRIIRNQTREAENGAPGWT